jgi:hypothetical protein
MMAMVALAGNAAAVPEFMAMRQLQGRGGNTGGTTTTGGNHGWGGPTCDYANIADLQTALHAFGCDLANNHCSEACAVAAMPIFRECSYLIYRTSHNTGGRGGTNGRGGTTGGRGRRMQTCACQTCMDNGNTLAQCTSYGMNCACATNPCACQTCLDDGNTAAQCISYGMDCTGCSATHSHGPTPAPPPAGTATTTVAAFYQTCQHTIHPQVAGSETDAECSDGIDNDGDGQADCDDVDCCYLRSCQMPTGGTGGNTGGRGRRLQRGGGTTGGNTGGNTGGRGGRGGSTGGVTAVCRAYRTGNRACSTCDNLIDFTACSTFINSVCCDEANEDCSSGMPTTCNDDCASVLVPAAAACSTFLSGANAGWAATSAPMLRSVSQLCTLGTHNGGGTGGGAH